MDFKLYVISISLIIAACSNYRDYSPSPLEEENIIGSPIESLSSSSNGFNQSEENVLLYDQMTHKIKEFDLSNLSILNNIPVTSPDSNHSIIRPQTAKYLIDIANKTISIIDENLQTLTPDLGFQGVPKSAAYNETNGILIVYDDLSSVVILKISNQGTILQKWLGGSVLSGKTISSGEILENGKLILSMTDGTVLIVDVAQTLTNQSWTYTSFSLSLGKLSWVAKINGTNSLVFVKSDDKLAIVNLDTQTIVAQTPLPIEQVKKLSKLGTPHVIFNSSNLIKLYYGTNTGSLQSVTLNQPINTIVVSNLDLANSYWEYIDSVTTSANLYMDWDDIKIIRTYKRLRTSDMLALKNISLPDGAQVRFSTQNLFYLYPSPLGFISKTSLISGAVTELKGFNTHEL